MEIITEKVVHSIDPTKFHEKDVNIRQQIVKNYFEKLREGAKVVTLKM